MMTLFYVSGRRRYITQRLPCEISKNSEAYFTGVAKIAKKNPELESDVKNFTLKVNLLPGRVQFRRNEVYLLCAAMIYPVKSASPSRLRAFNRAGVAVRRRNWIFYEAVLFKYVSLSLTNLFSGSAFSTAS